MPKPIPDGTPALTPYLCVDGAADAMKFYADVLEATERVRMNGPDGRVGHAEMELAGGALIMLADEHPDIGVLSPKTIGGTPVTLHLYVTDVDAVIARAVAAGGTTVGEIKDQFYGDRSGGFEDPFGHRWHIATHVEDVSEEEMARRAQEAGYG